MNRLITLTLFLLLFIACKKEKDDDFGSSFFWTPIIQLEKGDEKATLYLSDPRPFTDYVPGYYPTNPDFFEVYISEDNIHYSVYEHLDISIKSTEISELSNDKPCYVFVIAHKKDCKADTSNRIMVIPSKELAFEKYLEDVDYSVERISNSNDEMHISFMSNNYSGLVLYNRTKDSDNIILIEPNSYGAQWSNIENKFIYLTEIQEDIFIYPHKLKVFDVNEMESTTLLQIDYDEYYVQKPKFAPNEDVVTFLSSEDNKEKYIYDLWSINLNSGEKTNIVNFDNEGFTLSYEYVWNSTGDEFYMDGRYTLSDSPNNIYKMKIETKTIIPVIESQWQDKLPSLSPDNTKLLFISNRSGKDEIWLLDMNQQKYMQISGDNNYFFDSRYSNIQWLNNKEILITAFLESNSKALKVIVD